MTKLIALVAAGAFAAGTMFAGEHGDCTKKAGNEGKMACTASLATLDLTADQKTKMETAMTEHHKAGCTEATEAKFMKDAKGILTPEQFAKFKAECKKRKGRSLNTLLRKRRSPPLLSAGNHDRARFGGRDLRTHEIFRLPSLRARLYGCHLSSSCFPLLDFAGMAVNAVTVNSRTCFGIATAFGVVNFAENEFKICVRRLFGAVRDAIQ